MHFFSFRSFSVVDDARHWRNGWVISEDGIFHRCRCLVFPDVQAKETLALFASFVEGVSSSRIWLREGRRCPTLTGMICSGERCHGNLLQTDCTSTPTKTISVLRHVHIRRNRQQRKGCRVADSWITLIRVLTSFNGKEVGMMGRE